jgi:hypothetical protein
MARLVKELVFYSSLPVWIGRIKTDGHWGKWIDIELGAASVPLGKKLRRFFSADEQAQLAAAGSAEMVDLPWLTEAVQ